MPSALAYNSKTRALQRIISNVNTYISVILGTTCIITLHDLELALLALRQLKQFDRFIDCGIGSLMHFPKVRNAFNLPDDLLSAKTIPEITTNQLLEFLMQRFTANIGSFELHDALQEFCKSHNAPSYKHLGIYLVGEKFVVFLLVQRARFVRVLTARALRLERTTCRAHFCGTLQSATAFVDSIAKQFSSIDHDDDNDDDDESRSISLDVYQSIQLQLGNYLDIAEADSHRKFKAYSASVRKLSNDVWAPIIYSIGRILHRRGADVGIVSHALLLEPSQLIESMQIYTTEAISKHKQLAHQLEFLEKHFLRELQCRYDQAPCTLIDFICRHPALIDDLDQLQANAAQRHSMAETILEQTQVREQLIKCLQQSYHADNDQRLFDVLQSCEASMMVCVFKVGGLRLISSRFRCFLPTYYCTC
jgi:hypothetical protein